MEGSNLSFLLLEFRGITSQKNVPCFFYFKVDSLSLKLLSRLISTRLKAKPSNKRKASFKIHKSTKKKKKLESLPQIRNNIKVEKKLSQFVLLNTIALQCCILLMGCIELKKEFQLNILTFKHIIPELCIL